MRRPGFTFIELALVMGILGTLTSFAIPMYRSFQVRTDLNIAAEQITQGMARAKFLSQTSKLDAVWGFHLPTGVLFKGDTYATRDTSYDESYPVPQTLNYSGLTEVTFSKVDGRPSATGSVTVTSLIGEQRSVNISIDQIALPTNENDYLTFCHKPDSLCETKHMPESSWSGHRGHGDTLGACGPPSCP